MVKREIESTDGQIDNLVSPVGTMYGWTDDLKVVEGK